MEYMVRVWGGAWNDDANPSIEKNLNIKEGAYYFNDKSKKDEFIEILRNPIYMNQGIAIVQKEGELKHKRTIFVGTFKYLDKEFVIHHDFGYEYDEEDAKYIFENGNWSCDCNRSLFIRDEYGEDAIPELDCGSKIILTEYHFEYLS